MGELLRVRRLERRADAGQALQQVTQESLSSGIAMRMGRAADMSALAGMSARR